MLLLEELGNRLTAMIVRLSAYRMDFTPDSLMMIQVVFLQNSQAVSLSQVQVLVTL